MLVILGTWGASRLANRSEGVSFASKFSRDGAQGPPRSTKEMAEPLVRRPVERFVSVAICFSCPASVIAAAVSLASYLTRRSEQQSLVVATGGSSVLCDDSYINSGDGRCQDGGHGFYVSRGCLFGSDCLDCGPRFDESSLRQFHYLSEAADELLDDQGVL